MATLEHKKWSGKTDGTLWMQRSLIVIIRLVGLRTVYALMALVIPFYMIFNRNGYRAMKQYFEAHRGSRGLKTVGHIYRNHFVFGQVILDRFAAYGGMKFKVEADGLDLFNRTMESPSGVVLLSSHVGNYELAGYTLISQQKVFNALVYGGETETVMQNRARILSQHGMRMIPVRDDMSHLFAVNAALDDGQIVSIPADRTFGSPKTLLCDFMGAQAQFPMGAFALAAQKEVPVLAIFVMKESVRGYKAYVREIATPAGRSIKQRMPLMAQQFASELESIVDRYPHQWFNYYDFWQHNEKA